MDRPLGLLEVERLPEFLDSRFHEAAFAPGGSPSYSFLLQFESTHGP